MSAMSRCNKVLSRRLPAEIVEFCRFLEPTAAEALERQEAVQRVSAVITGIWKSASVEIFGSFVTGGQAGVPAAAFPAPRCWHATSQQAVEGLHVVCQMQWTGPAQPWEQWPPVGPEIHALAP